MRPTGPPKRVGWDSVPAGGVLGPLRAPELSSVDDAADYGGGGDEQVSGSLQEGRCNTQGFSAKKEPTPVKWNFSYFRGSRFAYLRTFFGPRH